LVSQHLVYFTKDNRPTTRRTKQVHVMSVLGNESFRRKDTSSTTLCWGVQEAGRLKCVTKSRDEARAIRRNQYQTGRVIALG